jgi:hypothetical protein
VFFSQQNAGDEKIYARLESGTAATGDICYQDDSISSLNQVDVVCDAAAATTALNDAGHHNIFKVSSVANSASLVTLGTVAATSQYQYVDSANSLNSMAVSTLNGMSIPTGTGSVVQKTASGTATVDLASVASGACTADSSDVTLTGAAVGDPTRVTAATALPAGVWLIGRVTASNTGRFQLCNLSGGAVDRASDTYTISIIK